MRERYLAFIARHEAVWELTFAALAIAFVIVGSAEGKNVAETHRMAHQDVKFAVK